MSVAIFSDTHIYNRFDPRKKVFLKALQELSSPGPLEVEELWFVGDIFDMMIGSFRFWEQVHADFFSLLERITNQGVRIVWMEGNHDFLIRPLLKKYRVECFEDPTEMEVQGRRVYLAHGDEVDQNNRSYLQWRKKSRGAAFRGLVNHCPEKVAHRMLLPIGEKLSAQSRRRHKNDAPEFYRTMFRDFAYKRWEEGLDGVFLGHSHVFDRDSNGKAFYLNLGSWFDKKLCFGFWSPCDELAPRLLQISLEGVITKVDG